MNCVRLLLLAQRQRYSVFHISTVRFISHHPIRFMETQNKWRENDGVSKRWQLIYKAPMDTAINYISTYLTVTTTMISAATLYYATFVFDKANLYNPVTIGENVVIANSPVECLTYLTTFIALHIAVKILVSKYVVRLYQDGDEYLAIFRGHIFNSVSKHKFHLKEFKKLSPTLVVAWGDARFDLGNKHGIILENYFKTPEYFNYLLSKKRHDRPDDD